MDINKSRLIEEFLELVQIDAATGDERALADRLIAKLTALHLNPQEDQVGHSFGGNTGNIFARVPANMEGQPTLLFCAHMDRVTPGKGIRPRVEEGVIRSDGSTILAADDVAGIAAILEGVRTILDNDLPHGDIEILFTVAEEGGLRGIKAFSPTQSQADFGFFLDSGGPVGTIIIQAPAQRQLKITFTGKAAHAGIAPEKGVSAVCAASRAVSRMKLGRIDSDTTANIGEFCGGGATNIVPERAVIKGEARSLQQDKLDEQTTHMAEACQQAARELGAQVDIEVSDAYPAYSHATNSPLVNLARQAALAINLPVRLEKTGGGSDANIMNLYGTPSAVLGVGFQNVHSKAESIAEVELVRAAEYVTSLIQSAVKP